MSGKKRHKWCSACWFNYARKYPDGTYASTCVECHRAYMLKYQRRRRAAAKSKKKRL